jgi:hypothetical protein
VAIRIGARPVGAADYRFSSQASVFSVRSATLARRSVSQHHGG